MSTLGPDGWTSPDNPDSVDEKLLAGWAATQSFIAMSNIVRDANGVLLSANVVWPDGTAGVWTTDSVNATTPAVDAWHCTYLGAVTKTATQPAVTRDADGVVTAQPAITIS